MGRRVYLGDGVYAFYDDQRLFLVVNDGIEDTETICLEPEVYDCMLRFVDNCRPDPPHQNGCICADCSGAELTADND